MQGSAESGTRWTRIWSIFGNKWRTVVASKRTKSSLNRSKNKGIKSFKMRLKTKGKWLTSSLTERLHNGKNLKMTSNL